MGVFCQDQSVAAAQQAAQAPASGLPAGQAAVAPAPAALPTRLVPARISGAIDLAPTALPAGQALVPTAATNLVPGIVQGPIAAQVSSSPNIAAGFSVVVALPSAKLILKSIHLCMLHVVAEKKNIKCFPAICERDMQYGDEACTQLPSFMQ